MYVERYTEYLSLIQIERRKLVNLAHAAKSNAIMSLNIAYYGTNYRYGTAFYGTEFYGTVRTIIPVDWFGTAAISAKLTNRENILHKQIKKTILHMVTNFLTKCMRCTSIGPHRAAMHVYTVLESSINPHNRGHTLKTLT